MECARCEYIAESYLTTLAIFRWIEIRDKKEYPLHNPALDYHLTIV